MRTTDKIVAAARQVVEDAQRGQAWNYDPIQVVALNAVEGAFTTFAATIEALDL